MQVNGELVTEMEVVVSAFRSNVCTFSEAENISVDIRIYWKL